jgi:hypothetical protein
MSPPPDDQAWAQFSMSIPREDLEIDLFGNSGRNTLVRSCEKRGGNTERCENRCRQMMAEAKVVSFDIFDTALRRKLGSPRHLFYIMEARLDARLSALLPAFARCRIEAEAEAWRRARRIRKTRQISLLEILAVLKERYRVTQEDIKILYELEIQTEIQFTYANPMFLRLHAEARERGLKVIFLSDMYLPSDCLQTMLQSHGFSDPQVFVSIFFILGTIIMLITFALAGSVGRRCTSALLVNRNRDREGG